MTPAEDPRPTFIDTHAHLSDPSFADDLEACLGRAREAGVAAVIAVGSDLPSSEQAIALADRFTDVYAAVGIHPHEASSVGPAHFDRLAELLHQPKVVAVGETGLDFHRNLAPPPIAEDVFRCHLKLAAEAGLPVIIHAREAHQAALDILKAVPDRPAAVLHCFDGPLSTAQRALGMGLFISFTGTLTFANAQALRRVAAELPLERVMIETDCPYLAPQPWRGKRNEPAYVVTVAEALAELHGLSFDEVARVTTENALRFFGLSR